MGLIFRPFQIPIRITNLLTANYSYAVQEDISNVLF